MQLQVDPNRILELSEELKRLNRIIEDNESGLNREMSRLLNDVRNVYPEHYVQSVVRETERQLREIRELAMQINNRLHHQTVELRRAADLFADSERRAMGRLSSKRAFNWFPKQVPVNPRFLTRVKAIAAQSVQTYKHSLLSITQGLLSKKEAASKTRALLEQESKRDIEERVRQAVHLQMPPMQLPDGTPITVRNKENEVTFTYFQERVLNQQEGYMNVEVPYTAYMAWLIETYGRNNREQSVNLSEKFFEGVVNELVSGVIDLGEIAIQFVINRDEMTKEAIEAIQKAASKVEYFMDHPEQFVAVARHVWQEFDQLSPEEKAESLGRLGSMFIPGVALIKVAKVGKVIDGLNEIARKIAGKIDLREQTVEYRNNDSETKTGNLDESMEGTPKANTKFSDMSADEQLAIAKQYSQRAPIEIPENANMKAKSMDDGYEQITYKWNDGTYKYEVRWHTRTSGAPADQGNTWVIQRTIPGSGGNKPQSFFKIGEYEWVEGYKWYDAIAARKAGTATPEQVRILDQGHWEE
jgi:hypothetical protein